MNLICKRVFLWASSPWIRKIIQVPTLVCTWCWKGDWTMGFFTQVMLQTPKMRCKIYDQRINFIDNEGSFGCSVMVNFVCKWEKFLTKLLHRSLFIGQMFSHSWISVATARAMESRSLNWILLFSRMGFLWSFQLSSSPSFCLRASESGKISRNFTRESAAKKYYLYWNEEKKSTFNKSKTNKTIGIFVQK